MNSILSTKKNNSLSLPSKHYVQDSTYGLPSTKQRYPIYSGRLSVSTAQAKVSPRVCSFRQKQKKQQIENENKRIFDKLSQILKGTKRRKLKAIKHTCLFYNWTKQTQQRQQSNKVLEHMLHSSLISNDQKPIKKSSSFGKQISTQKEVQENKVLRDRHREYNSEMKLPIIHLTKKNIRTLPIIWEEQPQYLYKAEDNIFYITIVKKTDYFQFKITPKQSSQSGYMYKMNKSQFLNQYHKLKGDYSKMIQNLSIINIGERLQNKQYVLQF